MELNVTLNTNVKRTSKQYKKYWYKKHREVIHEKQRQYQDSIKALYVIDLDNLENNPQWFQNNVLNSRRVQ